MIKLKLFCLLLAGILFFSCSSVESKKSDDIAPVRSDDTHAKYVFLIGLDGWGSFTIGNPNFNMPTVKSVIMDGSLLFTALSVIPSRTMPNWASMFMGTEPKAHGVRNNDTLKSPSSSPSIFTLLKQQQPNSKVAYFYEYSPLGYLCADNVIDNKMGIDMDRRDSEILKITDYITTEKPSLAVIVFNSPDDAGHKYRFGSRQYYAKLTELDRYIDIIFTSIKDAGIWDDSVIIITSDHGGRGFAHRYNTLPEREIPLFIMGKNIVKKGDRKIEEPIMVYDIGRTIAHIFQLDVPSSWQKKAKVLNVFEKY